MCTGVYVVFVVFKRGVKTARIVLPKLPIEEEPNIKENISSQQYKRLHRFCYSQQLSCFSSSRNESPASSNLSTPLGTIIADSNTYSSRHQLPHSAYDDCYVRVSQQLHRVQCLVWGNLPATHTHV